MAAAVKYAGAAVAACTVSYGTYVRAAGLPTRRPP